jgi:polyisoprenoid-binding protein YceI
MAWQVDMAHTQVAFAIRHLGISLIRGNMALADARLDLDEADPENTELTARIDVRTLDTHDANRDGHVKSADFFDVDKFPYIEFRTKNVRRTTNGKLDVTGDLTIKDVTRELRLQGSYDDPVSGKRKIGFALSGDVLKQDYGLSWNVPMESSAFMLADRVSLTIDAQAIEA